MRDAIAERAGLVNALMLAVATVGAPRTDAASAPPAHVRPIACAKRFGGPGTGRAGPPSRGTITRVTRSASGLRCGPAATRAANP